MRHLRIFISSPGDVANERLRAHLVIQKLARDYARFFIIEPILWEYEPMLASGHFQDAIDPPSESDIVVLVLWSRLGTPLPERTALREYRGIDGRVPVTGTEWEFEEALKAKRTKGAPDLLAYRRLDEPKVSLANEAELNAARRQFANVKDFWHRHFEDKGMFLAGSATFEGLGEFEARLERDLTALIEKRAAALVGEETTGPLWLKGSPFRGLASYDFADAPVFFGRDGATREGLTRLSGAAERNTAFLIVLGSSGSGKSSVARAGILPALVAPKAVPGVGLWRRVTMRPGDAGPDPVLALARVLAARDPDVACGLPELIGPDLDAADLARHLRASADDAGFPFRSALNAIATKARATSGMLAHEEAKLVILVDQLEEVFTRPDITAQDRAAFFTILNGLARSGVVWVIATMRSDLWHRAAGEPTLLALIENGARLDLLPPNSAEIQEMIRRPAQTAGLSFEIDHETGLGLDAVLVRAAAGAAGALPLLSVVLDTLYRRDIAGAGGRALTFATYRELGELQGAIAQRADETLASLSAADPAAAAALPQLLRALVTTSEGDAITSRPAALSSFAEGSPERRLIDALLAPDARLLTATGDGARAEVRLAHEALIEHWPRAKEQIAKDRRDIETRTQLETLLRRYDDAAPKDRKRALLDGLALEQGLDLVKRWTIPAAEPLGRFVKASDAADSWRRQRFIGIAAALVALFAGIAVVAGFQWREAEAQRGVAQTNAENARRQADIAAAQKQVAETNATEAERQRQAATQSAAEAERQRFAATQSAAEAARQAVVARQQEQNAQAERLRAEENAQRAKSEADRADTTLREGQTEESRRVAAVAHQLMDEGRGALATALTLQTAPRLAGAADRPLTVPTMTALQRSLRLRQEVERREVGKNVLRIAITANQRLAVTGTNDGYLQFWDLPDLKLRGSARAHEDLVTSIEISPDQRSVVVAGGQIPTVWDIEKGVKRFDLAVPNPKRFSKMARYSPDGKLIVVGSAENRVLVFDAANGKHLRTIEGPAFAAAYERTKARATKQGEGFGVADPIMSAVANAMFTINGTTTEIAVSPDGKTIAAAGPGDPEAAVRLYETATGKLRATVTGAQLTLMGSVMNYGENIQFDREGKRLAAIAAGANIMIVDVAKGTLLRDLSASDTDSVLLTNDGKMLLSGHRDGAIQVWCVDTGQLATTLRHHRDGIQYLGFNANERLFVSTAGDGTVSIWPTPATGDVCARQRLTDATERLQNIKPTAMFEGHRYVVHRAAFVADDTQLITTSRDGTVRLWTLSEKGTNAGRRHKDAPAWEFDNYRQSPKLLLSSDDRYAVSVGGRASEIWSLSDFTYVGGTDEARVAARRADGTISLHKSLFTATILDPKTGTLTPPKERDDGRFVYAPFDWGWEISPDARRAIGSKVWSAHYKELQSDTESPSSPLSPFTDKKDEPPPLLLDAADGRQIAELAIDGRKAASVRFSDDGTTVLARLPKAGKELSDATVFLAVWDAKDGKLLGRSLESKAGDDITIAASSDGRVLLVLGLGTERTEHSLFHLRNGALIPVALRMETRASQRQIKTGSVSADGRLAAAGYSDGSISIWNTKDGTLVNDLNSIAAPIRNLIFSPSADLIAASDRTNRIWIVDRANDFPIALPTFPEAPVELKFTSRGDRVVALAASGSVYAVDVRPTQGLASDEDLVDYHRASLQEAVPEADRRRYRLAAPAPLARPDLAAIKPVAVDKPLVRGSRSAKLAACDTAAADPFDRSRPATGVDFDKLAADTAIPLCAAALAEAPNDATTLYHLGRLYIRLGKPDDAMPYYRRAADADYAAAIYAISQILITADGQKYSSLGSGLEWIERAAKGGHPDALMDRAAVQVLNGIDAAGVERALANMLAAGGMSLPASAMLVGEILERWAKDDKARLRRALFFYELAFWLKDNTRYEAGNLDEWRFRAASTDRARRLAARLPAAEVVEVYRAARDWKAGAKTVSLAPLQ